MNVHFYYHVVFLLVVKGMVLSGQETMLENGITWK